MKMFLISVVGIALSMLINIFVILMTGDVKYPSFVGIACWLIGFVTPIVLDRITERR